MLCIKYCIDVSPFIPSRLPVRPNQQIPLCTLTSSREREDLPHLEIALAAAADKSKVRRTRGTVLVGREETRRTYGRVTLTDGADLGAPTPFSLRPHRPHLCVVRSSVSKRVPGKIQRLSPSMAGGNLELFKVRQSSPIQSNPIHPVPSFFFPTDFLVCAVWLLRHVPDRIDVLLWLAGLFRTLRQEPQVLAGRIKDE